MDKLFIPQLGVALGVLTVSQSNGWVVQGFGGPGFPEDAATPGFPGPPERLYQYNLIYFDIKLGSFY